MRKTKIISTLGPASDSDQVITHLIKEGTNVFRLNMSHAKHQWVKEVIHKIRASADEAGKFVGILMDLQGPAIRTGVLSTPIELCLLYTSPSPRDRTRSRMPSSA